MVVVLRRGLLGLVAVCWLWCSAAVAQDASTPPATSSTPASAPAAPAEPAKPAASAKPAESGEAAKPADASKPAEAKPAEPAKKSAADAAKAKPAAAAKPAEAAAAKPAEAAADAKTKSAPGAAAPAPSGAAPTPATPGAQQPAGAAPTTPTPGAAPAAVPTVGPAAPGPPRAAAAPPPPPIPVKMLVVPVRGRRAPNLKRDVRRRLEKPMRDHATIVPSKVYNRTARKLRIRRKQRNTLQAARQVGTTAGLTHVLFVESVLERQRVPGRRRPKKVYFASVNLIDVAKGESTFTSRYQLRGRRLTSDVAALMVAAVVPALRPAPEPAVDVAALEAARLAAEKAAAEKAAREKARREEEARQAAAKKAAEEEARRKALANAIDPGWRPGFSWLAGVAAMRREATLSSQQGRDEPCYCSRDGQTNPFFPGGYLALEVYPMAITDNKYKWWNGFGLHLNFFGTSVSTDVGTGSESSVVLDGSIGGSWRWVWWNSRMAPQFTAQVGYGYGSFPLTGSQFPSTAYAAPYGGGQFYFPIYKPQKGLFKELGFGFGGTYQFLIGAAGVKSFGTLDSGGGFKSEGGFKMVIGPVDVVLRGLFNQHNLTFSGNSDFGFSNVKLQDRYFGGYGAAGMSF